MLVEQLGNGEVFIIACGRKTPEQAQRLIQELSAGIKNSDPPGTFDTPLRSPYAYIDERDPYRHLLRNPDLHCEHGNGNSCECQLPVYEGLFVAPVEGHRDHITRRVVAKMQQAHEGGMRQFRDPISDEVVGSCGVHFAYTNVLSLEDWISEQNLP